MSIPAPVESTKKSPRVLIGGVGYLFLRDMSVGPHVIESLKAETWPETVEIEDLSYGPIGVMHNLDDRQGYEMMILIGGVRRNRTPGEVFSYRWAGNLPNEDEIQNRMAEAVTGVISLDNLLIIGTYFEKLPSDVRVIEIEAADEDWGEGLSSEVKKSIPQVVRMIRKMVKEKCD